MSDMAYSTGIVFCSSCDISSAEVKQEGRVFIPNLISIVNTHMYMNLFIFMPKLNHQTSNKSANKSIIARLWDPRSKPELEPY